MQSYLVTNGYHTEMISAATAHTAALAFWVKYTETTYIRVRDEQDEEEIIDVSLRPPSLLPHPKQSRTAHKVVAVFLLLTMVGSFWWCAHTTQAPEERIPNAGEHQR